MADTEIIPTDRLNAANVPSPETASREALETFAMTYDGYRDGKRSVDEMLGLAERVERDGLENAALDDLRAVAFIRQREMRWDDYGPLDHPLLRNIRAAIAEIRKRVSQMSSSGEHG